MLRGMSSEVGFWRAALCGACLNWRASTQTILCVCVCFFLFAPPPPPPFFSPHLAVHTVERRRRARVVFGCTSAILLR